MEVGEIGSDTHTQRERMLRTSIQLQTQLKQCEQKLEALSQQLTAATVDAQTGRNPAGAAEPMPQPASSAADSKADLQSAVKPGHASALIESLFGSDDDADTAETVSPAEGLSGRGKSNIGAGGKGGLVQAQHQSEAARLSGLSADVSQQAGAKARQGSVSIIAVESSIPNSRPQHNVEAGPSQQPFDPTAPKRRISFNNSLKRRQASGLQQRRDAFNEAADAAISQALAQHTVPGSQAAELASQPSSDAAAARQEADESSHLTHGTTWHKLIHNAGSVVQLTPAPQAQTDAQTNSSMAEKALSRTPGSIPNSSSGTRDLPAGRVQSINTLASTSSKPGDLAQDAPKVTRTSQAEPAPKLKTGSRLAASMAKMAASKRAGSEQTEPAVGVTVNPTDNKQKQSAIPEDVKRALLAKVCPHRHAVAAC